jgi:transposase-like protein
VISRLTVAWQEEARRFHQRDLSAVDYVYMCADGVHLGVRLDEKKLCLLVMIGVRMDGSKELVALAEGYRESPGSWADLLRDAARRGMRAPVLTVGDGALGFWAALREVFPETREQRCWFHKIANVLSGGSKAAGLAMAFKLIGAARRRWRAVNAPHLVALLRAGARFEHGKLVERPAKVAA